MTTPRYIYDHEEETHRRMQTDPNAIHAATFGLKLIEKSKSEAKVYLQEDNVSGFNPWILISGLDPKETDDVLKEQAIQRLKFLREVKT